MIVINRNGQRTVITGWREWVILLPAMFLIALAVLALLGLALGLAATLITLVLIALPVAIVLALIVSLFGRQRAVS
ncbi:MAG: hypothetical protein ACRECO_04645 [Xanthobacteraceae bacterium]